VLPLLGTVAEPAVVREVDEEIEVILRGLAGDGGEGVFKANEDGGLGGVAGRGGGADGNDFIGGVGFGARLQVHFIQGEGHGIGAGGPPTDNGSKPLQEGQPAHEGDIFAEDDELLLVVGAGEFAPRFTRKAALK